MQYDTIIVGGSFAGLAAATYLARARRHVHVLDTGKPRNRFAAASHGFLGNDGGDPKQMLTSAREQLRVYPTLQFTQEEAHEASMDEDGFCVHLAGGGQLEARTLIMAFGLRDTLPTIAGLVERWGKTVLHCPYCHGFEFADRALGVLYRNEMSAHQALIVAEWGPTTLFLNGNQLTAEETTILKQKGIGIEAMPIKQLEGDGSALSAIRLKDGTCRLIKALYVLPLSELSSPVAEQLGVETRQEPMGPIVSTDENRLSSVRGVYAAGDIARAPHSISWAVADGVTAGTAAHRALVFG